MNSLPLTPSEFQTGEYWSLIGLLITSHVTLIKSSDWLFTCFGRFLVGQREKKERLYKRIQTHHNNSNNNIHTYILPIFYRDSMLYRCCHYSRENRDRKSDLKDNVKVVSIISQSILLNIVSVVEISTHLDHITPHSFGGRSTSGSDHIGGSSTKHQITLLSLELRSVRSPQFASIINMHSYGYGFLDEPIENPLHSCPGESLLKLQCGQTFLGILCSQFHPVHDVVTLIETLDSANIRFVHFSSENELRSRAFGTKLGLETGWNCHISLAEGDFDQFSVDSDTSADERNIFHSNYKARLPQGIRSIKPHLESVDNVPLLVPLFSSCTPPAIREMIQIMQENNELVCCVGSSLQSKNFRVFLQADSGIGMVPHLPQQCLISGIKDITLPWPTGDYVAKTSDHTSLTCLHLSSILNTLPCSLVLSRDNLIVDQLIRVARHTSVSLKQSGHLMLGMYVSLSLYSLIHQLLLLPPPLSVPGCLILCLLNIPILSTLPFTLCYDPAVMQLHTGKREADITDTGRQYQHFLGRWSTLFLIGPLITCGSLYTSCSYCNVWVTEQDGVLDTIQRFNLGIVTLIQVVNSVVFAHRTKKLSLRYFLKNWTASTFVLALLPTIVTAVSIIVSLPAPVPIPSAVSLIILPLLQLGFSERDNLERTRARKKNTTFVRAFLVFWGLSNTGLYCLYSAFPAFPSSAAHSLTNLPLAVRFLLGSLKVKFQRDHPRIITTNAVQNMITCVGKGLVTIWYPNFQIIRHSVSRSATAPTKPISTHR
eukprot:sb/3462316/